MIPAPQALDRLIEGNKRFAAAARRHSTHTGSRRRTELPDAQSPFAIVLGCADSRVPPELVFDQGLGDLFVVRVAGNVVGPPQMGSIEFAASQFGSRLIVVLGHSGCGAVRATIDHVSSQAQAPSDGLKAIIDGVSPAVREVLDQGEESHDTDEVMRMAVRANVSASVRQLHESSPILSPLIASQELMVIGAEYSLKDGTVEFFEKHS